MTKEQLDIFNKRLRESYDKQMNENDAINIFEEFIYNNISHYRPDESLNMFDVACFTILDLAYKGMC